MLNRIQHHASDVLGIGFIPDAFAVPLYGFDRHKQGSSHFLICSFLTDEPQDFNFALAEAQ